MLPFRKFDQAFRCFFPARGHRTALLTDRRSTTSLELAICAVPFFAMMLGLMDMGYDLFLQAELDTAVQQAARDVQVGSVEGTGETSAQLAAAAVCPNLRNVLDCGRLMVGVTPVPPAGTDANGNPIPGDYYTSKNIISLGQASSPSGVVCTGAPGQLMVLQAWYIGPTFIGQLVPYFSTVYKHNHVHITSASAAFVNEYFTGGETCTAAT